jgi:hypothetical protein
MVLSALNVDSSKFQYYGKSGLTRFSGGKKIQIVFECLV